MEIDSLGNVRRLHSFFSLGMRFQFLDLFLGCHMQVWKPSVDAVKGPPFGSGETSKAYFFHEHLSVQPAYHNLGHYSKWKVFLLQQLHLQIVTDVAISITSHLYILRETFCGLDDNTD